MPVCWKDVFSKEGYRHYFNTKMKKQSPEERHSAIRASRSVSHFGRYHKHQLFLTDNNSQIKVFADIGCGIGAGAPTTLDAKRALGEGARVFAVDAWPAKPEIERILKRKGVEFVFFENRGEEPLSERLGVQCDAIRMANVSQWMSQSERRRALVNIWNCLKPGGFLLGASTEREFVLRKTARGWEEILLG
jgi:SAM-dependent methyltransferase